MSTHISVSDLKHSNCNHILRKMKEFDINCRIIETSSIVGKNLEKGCLITLGPPYNQKDHIKKLWNLIKDDYNCAHLLIDGDYNGCIYNYLNANFCPEN